MFTEKDFDILKQTSFIRYLKVKVLSLNKFGNFRQVDEISGKMLSCSVNVDADSDLRRSCSIELVVENKEFEVSPGSDIWLDKYISPQVGYEDRATGEIYWYNQGIYLVDAPSWRYDAITNSLSIQGLDLMSKLTGTRNGYLPGIPTVIPQGSSVKGAIIAAIQLMGFNKYIVNECQNVDGSIQEVPYDIQIDQGGTIYDILSELRDILPNYQIYFDIDGVFHYEPIPDDDNDSVLIDDSFLKWILIGEDIDTDFQAVKNVIEVYGRTHDVSYYYSDAIYGVVRYEGANVGAIEVKYAPQGTLLDGTIIGLTVPNYSGNLYFIAEYDLVEGEIEVTELYEIYDTNGSRLYELPKKEYAVLQYKDKELGGGYFIYIGRQQAYGEASDNDINSPFYIGGSVGSIRKVCYGGEYDNITTDDLALQRAAIELYWAARLNDTVKLTTLPVPWLDVNILMQHAVRDNEEMKKYIVKSYSVDYSEGGTSEITAMTFYPYYATAAVEKIVLAIHGSSGTEIVIQDANLESVAIGTIGASGVLNLQVKGMGTYTIVATLNGSTISRDISIYQKGTTDIYV